MTLASSLRLCGAVFFLCLLGGEGTYGADPSWWTSGSTPLKASGSFPVEANYSPANIGQLKNAAARAKEHLHAAYPGGPWQEIDDLVAEMGPANGTSFTTAEINEHYGIANIGQLKSVAKVFYEALSEAGYNSRQNLRDRGYPSTWKYFYPYDPYAPIEGNYAPANVGQLKMVFSFDLAGFNPASTTDTDGDGLSDVWEIQNGFDPNLADENNNGIVDGSDDFDGDGVTNLAEKSGNTDPWNAGDATNPPSITADTTNQTSLMVWTPFN